MPPPKPGQIRAFFIHSCPTLMSTLVLVVGFCTVAVLVYMARYSGRVRVDQVRLIDAPPQQVYAQLVNLAQWQQWNPWLAVGPAATQNVSQPAYQISSSCTWERAGAGSGSIKHLRLQPLQSLEQQLSLRQPFKVTGRSSWTLQSVGSQTEVRWSLRGRVAFSMRAFAATVQGSLALDCRYGLDQLASLLEPASAPRYRIVHEGVRDVASQAYVYSAYNGPISGLAQAVRTAVAELRTHMAELGAQVTGVPMALYFRTNIKLRTTVCHIGLPVARVEDAHTLSVREMPACRAYVVRLEGDPSAMEIAWYHAMQRMVAEKIKPDQRLPPFERYLVSGDGDGQFHSDCVTELHVPVL